MKQDISALMDGELFDDEADVLFDKLKRQPEAREEWHTYHLISDVLGQRGRSHIDISATMSERLQDEPTVLAPRANSGKKASWFALSAAASVMALTVVAWLSMQVGSDTTPQMALFQQPASIHVASYPVSSRFANNSQGNGQVNKGQNQNELNDYLMAHQEFSPSTNVQGAASYIRTLAAQ